MYEKKEHAKKEAWNQIKHWAGKAYKKQSRKHTRNLAENYSINYATIVAINWPGKRTEQVAGNLARKHEKVARNKARSIQKKQ